jgi:hypothetical protein
VEKLKTYGTPVVIALALIALFGYSLGKSMALRDNARAVETRTAG